MTGTNRARPGLREALAACRAGDTLVVTKLDRLARSLRDAKDIVDDQKLHHTTHGCRRFRKAFQLSWRSRALQRGGASGGVSLDSMNFQKIFVERQRIGKIIQKNREELRNQHTGSGRSFEFCNQPTANTMG